MTLDHTIAGRIRVVLLAHIADCRICGISIEHLTTLVCHSLATIDFALCDIKSRVDVGFALAIQTHTRDNGMNDLFLCLHYRHGFHAIKMQLIAQPPQFHTLADLRRNSAGAVMVQLTVGIIRVIILVLSGLGIAIVSTSRGVMTGAQARKQSIGGELLALVW